MAGSPASTGTGALATLSAAELAAHCSPAPLHQLAISAAATKMLRKKISQSPQAAIDFCPFYLATLYNCGKMVSFLQDLIQYL